MPPQRSRRHFAIRSFVALAFLAILVSGCAEEAPPAASGTGGLSDAGSVGVFLTQSPSAEFDRILLTIERIQLVGSGAPVTIFSGRETVDLGDLEHFSDLFVFAEDVAVGPYHKIRLSVAEVQVEYEGQVYDLDAPANGKVDLIPPQPFRIPSGGAIMIEISLDPDKAVHLHMAGVGEVIFRPVIFITLDIDHSPPKLARVHGEVVETWRGSSFVLCSTVYMASRYIAEGDPSRIDGGLGDRHRCLFVETDAHTGVFDESGDPARLTDLETGDEATVVGHFVAVGAGGELLSTPESVSIEWLEELEAKYTDEKGKKEKKPKKDEDTDTGGGSGGPGWPGVDLLLVAAVVEQGPVDAFDQLGGVIESRPNRDDLFDFGVDAGQGFEPGARLPALLQARTRVFSASGVELDDDEVAPERDAEIDGVIADSGSLGGVLKTALIVVGVEPSGGVPGEPGDALSGEVFLIDEDAHAFALTVIQAGIAVIRCVSVPSGAEILLIETAPSGTSRREGAFADLMDGQSVDVYGPSDDAECFAATTVVVYLEPEAP